MSAAKGFDDNGECWPWPGSLNPKTGYGQLSDWRNGKRRLLTAHRVARAAFGGGVPAGLSVLHRCDNRACFNPEHLFLGSQSDNMRDMMEKGRADHTRNVRGVDHYAAKLSGADVVAIRQDVRPLPEIAASYGMSVSAVHAAKRRRTWKHII
jgi:hypothetical protein